MFRDFKTRCRIIWLLLTNKYTRSIKYKKWWLWNNEYDKEDITIIFGEEE
jgi:hypothetical protein